VSTSAITAAVVESAGAPFELGPAELGEVQADEVRVRMTASGICHTDLLIREGTFPTPMPVVLGHEYAGIVSEVGSAVTDAPRRRSAPLRSVTPAKRTRWAP